MEFAQLYHIHTTASIVRKIIHKRVSLRTISSSLVILRDAP